MFRVHKSVLSMHSPVFNDMFTLPDTAACSELVGRQAESVNSTSGSVNETYEGVPVVELPDTVEQVEQLLSIFYNPLSP